MITDAEGAFWRKAAGSRLEALFGDITHAIEEGRLSAALRLADRACRIAPKNPTCLLLHARLLMRLGAASEAAERLRGRDEPEAIAIRAEALCAQGFWDAAAASCEMLLGRFAVDAVEGLPLLATRLCRTPEATKFPGWVGVDSKLRVVGRFRRDHQVTITSRDVAWSPTIVAVDQDALDLLRFEVPAGFSGQLSVCTGDRRLLGSNFLWPPEFGLSGWVAMNNQELRGEVHLGWAPALPVTVTLGHCGTEHSRLSVSPSDGSVGSHFSLALDRLDRQKFPLEVCAVLPDGTSCPLTGSPVGMQLTAPNPVSGLVRRPSPPTTDQDSAPTQKIDIVVPVYAGRDETLLCIERVLATMPHGETELVVVNDASPDSELRAALARLADDGRITLLTNKSNLGFPGAANRGMNLHPERDIVLLNADTELFGDWLKRLKCAAYSAPDIGTVTPLGEVASITSYPGKAEYAHMTEAAEEIDRIACQVNAGKVVELPVGVGFCLYIKRACLQEIGGFDERTFDKGYGEENDFCLRARGLGWRHVAATNLFVRHRGARSYGHKTKALKERNRHVLNARYPGYDAMISDFIAADPLLGARRAIDIDRLLKTANDPVLLVTFGLPGGVKRHVEERESALSSDGRTVLVMQPGPSSRLEQVILRVQDLGMENLAFNLPEELPVLRALLLGLRLSSIELHHFAGLPAASLEMVADLGIPYDVYVHDYSWICPRLSLTGENGGYCGEPPVEECETCIRKLGTALEESLTVEALRLRSARILAGARAVIVPSHDVLNRLARYFPALSIQVIGWEKPIVPMPRASTTPSGRVHVAVIGAISIPKGHQVLLDCARDAAVRGLDLDFVVIGYTHDDEALLETGRAFITGPYADSEVGGLLEREQPHITFFPSIVPETWSYALSHALTRSLPIVAFDLGAIAERLRTYEAAEVLPLSTAAWGINDALLRLARRIDTSNSQDKELAMNPTPTKNDELVTSSEPVSQELAASVQLLTLPVGTYACTVKGGASADTPSEELTLPALQIGLAPMRSPGTAEFLAGATTLDRWLARGSDVVIVKVSGGSVSLLLTSLRLPSSPVLAIDVRRIDVQPNTGQPEVQSDSALPVGQPGVLPAQIVAHIRNVGDIHFNEGWAGCLGDKLWIEGFAIMSLGGLPPDAIEYCGVAADGFQTAWVSGQALCGSRGQGLPIMGYAVRLKPEFADRYDCTYSGRFVSGSARGPFKNAELCCSEVAGDPLWGIELMVAPRGTGSAKKPSGQMQYSSDVA